MNDQELEIALKKTAKQAREVNAEGIALLAEFGRRNLHVTAGCSSLFVYCVRALNFSNHTAWRWSNAAKAVLRGVDVVERLKDGRLCLCVAAKLAKYPELLARADGVTAEQAEQMIVAAQPRAEKKDVIPKHAAPDPKCGFEFRPEPAVKAEAPSEIRAEPVAPPPAPKRPEIKPVSAQKDRLHFDVRKETLAKLRRARELQPGKDLDAILEAALDAYLDRHAPERRHERRQKRAAKKKAEAPRARKAGKGRRALPQATKDAVQVAAGCQCTYVGRSGLRCAERVRLEHDHIQPRALGGSDEKKNLRPLCLRHHQQVTSESFPGWAPY